jgi:hypothetical protein
LFFLRSVVSIFISKFNPSIASQKLVGFIHSSVNFPAFTQAINASFGFPILRAIAIDVSFPKRLICKARPFVLQSGVRFVKDSPVFDRSSLSNVIQSSLL